MNKRINLTRVYRDVLGLLTVEHTRGFQAQGVRCRVHDQYIY